MLPIISFIITFALVWYFIDEQKRHDSKIFSIKYRIHVNGIRGKSSVTRLIASVLREGKIITTGKATGSDTNIITPEGEDLKVNRKGPANVFENFRIINEHVGADIEAIVFECMAVKPQYQRFLEEKVIKSNIGIITNVREDHVEEMGHTLKEIARSLSSTIPVNGHLICADENVEVQKVLQKACTEKNTKFINALEYQVPKNYLFNFPYLEHKENIMVGLAVADLLNISSKTALIGMIRAKPDPGVLSIKKYSIGNKNVIWANLFAANDKQSVVRCVEMVMKKFKALKPETICLLNNRFDRPERADHFSKFVVSDFSFDHIAIIGDLQKQVANNLRKEKYTNIIEIPVHKTMTGVSLIESMLAKTKNEYVLILGMENIHTQQADLIIDYFTNKATAIN